MSETILLVDDEEPVRQTLREWLDSADLDCTVLAAGDAEEALVLADRHLVDLAVLDWNLGAGNDGLHLLEDLVVFNPDVVAILITGYAHQATPLDAMRMGVRDYLDKNQEFDRGSFLRAVRRQLDRIGPAKRERRLHQSLAAFREAVEKVLPLVQSTAALTDPLSPPEAISSLFRFVLRTTGARDGVLLVRSYDEGRQPAEQCRVYDATGQPLTVELVPFARSLAGSAVAQGHPAVVTDLDELATDGTVLVQAFERGRASLLFAPLPVATGLHVVLELFDKPAPGFSADDQRLVTAAADFGGEVLKHALAQRQTHRVLFDAVAAALGASRSVSESLAGTPSNSAVEPPPAAVLDQLREGLRTAVGDAGETVRLAEAIRALAVRHGEAAVRHCTLLVEDLRVLLDRVAGVEPEGRAWTP